VNLQSQQNSIDAVDIPSAATHLSQDQIAQSATLAALAKVLPLSLMDYLK
jgi:flagellin-like hook-associated protein FlgL